MRGYIQYLKDKVVSYSKKMGIYPNHGLEYWVELSYPVPAELVEDKHHRTNFGVRLVSVSDADERLLKSLYYQKRKTGWFTEREFSLHYIVQAEGDCDINLTEAEHDTLFVWLDHLFPYVIRHGWYEANYIQDSMEIVPLVRQ